MIRTTALLLLVLLFSAPIAGAAAPPGPAAGKPAEAAPITPLSPAELATALKGGAPLVMEFGGETCIPCRQMQPVLQEIRAALGKKGRVHNFWIQTYPEVAREHKVMAMPTQIVFDAKGVEVYRHIGVLPLADFQKILKEKGIL